MRAGIQNDLILREFSGFPFDASTLLSIDPELCRRVDFAQGGEPVEPRVSPNPYRVRGRLAGSPGMTALLNCDTASDEENGSHLFFQASTPWPRPGSHRWVDGKARYA
jgi:hypothetical protein